jgi:pyrrolidone-carboxylate peptidase
VKSRTLVTGFGPFLNIRENPSSMLAAASGRSFELLEVSYAGVRQFVEQLDGRHFDRLLLMGVNARADRMHLEVLGRNEVGSTPDVLGHVPELRVAREENVYARTSTLWRPLLERRDLGPNIGMSESAGGYLCNFALYEALRRFPDKQVGFLHVPSPDALSLETMEVELHRLLRMVEE